MAAKKYGTIITIIRPKKGERIDSSKHIRFDKADMPFYSTIDWKNPRENIRMVVNQVSKVFDKQQFEEKIFGEYRCFNLTNGNAGHTNSFEIVQNGIYFELTKDEKRFFISQIRNVILPNKFKDKVVNAPDWIIDNKKMNLIVKDFLENNSRR